jgi:hypothetical protein
MAKDLNDSLVLRTARAPMAFLTVGGALVLGFFFVARPDPDEPFWFVAIWALRAITLAAVVAGVLQFFRPSQLVLTRAGFLYSDVFGHRIEVLWPDVQDLGIYEQVRGHGGPFRSTTRYVGWNYSERFKAAGRWKPRWWESINKGVSGFDWTLPPYWPMSPGELLHTMKQWAGRP